MWLIILKIRTCSKNASSSLFGLENSHEDVVRLTKTNYAPCFVIGWLVVEGGTSAVALSDWTAFLLVKPFLGSLRQVDGQNNRGVERCTGDGANSGNNSFQHGLLGICASHFSNNFTFLTSRQFRHFTVGVVYPWQHGQLSDEVWIKCPTLCYMSRCFAVNLRNFRCGTDDFLWECFQSFYL